MPRPIRIEYENASYHVMNRGAGYRDIFHDKKDFEAFLQTLEEAHKRFGIQVLCYCLMSNHYHLLLKTPEANLGRAMRHINGVYTQRYNRLHKTDGALFRGRYKAILVEEDSYQLQVSRYIHRNPAEAQMVDQLEDYPWSSYPVYLKRKRVPVWLYPQEIYAQLGVKQKVADRYRAFVEMGVDEELAHFYGKGNQVPYLGSDQFREWAYRQRQTDDREVSQEDLQVFRPDFELVIKSISEHFGVSISSIVENQRGRQIENIPRWGAMYLGRDLCGLKLRKIADYLKLKRTGSIPNNIAKLSVRMQEDKALYRQIEKIKGDYGI